MPPAPVTVTVDGKAFTVDKGSTFTLPAAPTKSGYVFKGWKDQNGNLYPANKSITVTDSMTFTADWVKDETKPVAQFTVTFNLGGGTLTGKNPLTVKDGDSITLGTPTRDNYSFTAWEDQSGKRYNAGDSVIVKANMTFTAIWQEIEAVYTYTVEDITDAYGATNFKKIRVYSSIEGEITSKLKGIYDATGTNIGKYDSDSKAILVLSMNVRRINLIYYNGQQTVTLKNN